jgi:hypothetical protein
MGESGTEVDAHAAGVPIEAQAGYQVVSFHALHLAL